VEIEDLNPEIMEGLNEYTLDFLLEGPPNNSWETYWEEL